jgi:Xaa-Pro aminopeptidase
MDVHDTGLYLQEGKPRPLQAGMVLTIEPGFYVQPTDRDAPAAFRNIGIRIEDDVLVTDAGPEVLTAGVPKSREQIEALRAF